MKRIIAAAIAGLFTFGGAYGLAASLNLTTEGVGAATNVVAACQAGTLDATYTTSYSASLPGYTVSAVTVDGLTAACYGKAFRVTLSGTGDASLGEVTGTTPTSGTSFGATFTPAIGVENLLGLSVVISG